MHTPSPSGEGRDEVIKRIYFAGYMPIEYGMQGMAIGINDVLFRRAYLNIESR